MKIQKHIAFVIQFLKQQVILHSYAKRKMTLESDRNSS